MARFPIYTRDGDVVRTSQEPVAASELFFEQFIVDATGGATTVVLPYFGQSGCNYRILSIYYDILTAGGFVRFSLRKPPAVIGSVNFVADRFLIIAAAGGMSGMLSDGGSDTNTVIGVANLGSHYWPAIPFNSQMQFEITMSAGNYGSFTIYFERINS